MATTTDDRAAPAPAGDDDATLWRLRWQLHATDFLYREAELLDRNLLGEWVDGCLDDEVRYFMPVRWAGDEGDPLAEELGHFDEDRAAIEYRVATLLAPSSFAGKPPSRMRRCVTNVRVATPAPGDDRVAVRSYVVLFRNRFNETSYDILSAEREDVLRVTDTGLRLSQRLIVVDEATLGTDNLAVFL